MGDRKVPSLPPSERHPSDPVSKQIRPEPPPAPPPKRFRSVRRALHRLRFSMWLLGADDQDGFVHRAQVLHRVRRGLLGARAW